jgi:hypothetical protein
LAKDPEQRYQNCTELAQDLSKLAKTTFVQPKLFSKYKTDDQPDDAVTEATQSLTRAIVRQAGKMPLLQVVFAIVVIFLLQLIAGLASINFTMEGLSPIWKDLGAVLYYLPALLAYPITRRRGIGVIMQAILHVGMMPLAVSFNQQIGLQFQADVIQFTPAMIVAGIASGVVLESAWINSKLPAWISLPGASVLSLVLVTLIETQELTISSPLIYLSAVLVGVLAYFLALSYQSVRKVQAEVELQQNLKGLNETAELSTKAPFKRSKNIVSLGCLFVVLSTTGLCALGTGSFIPLIILAALLGMVWFFK